MSKTLIHQYRRDLESRKRYGGSSNESSIRYAFATLLNGYCKPKDFLLVEELTINSRFNKPIRLDGIVKDALRLDWGYWEAKDEKDSLDAEIEAKFSKGYPNDNILFEDSKTAVLIQNGQESLRIDMEDDEALDALLNQFLDYERAEVKDFRQAISNFSQDLPTIINSLRKLIDSQDPSPLIPLPEGEGNKKFIEARDKFLKICQESINPDIKIDDIREMIIQHILTEDIFTNIFSDAQFHQENNIARQLNDVIKTFFTGSVKKNTFKTIQSYYNAIIRTASSIVNHQEKQKFLKVVYENFYKAYNPKEADRLGIVYTPNEIVKFMVESTNYLLEKHFDKTLGDKGVEILDPCTGTGTFITQILDYLLTRDIEYKYQNEIHCNEMSILPYYIANLNIEYTYQQKTGEYLEFNNICLMDTLDHSNFGGKQFDLFAMSQENTERIKRQNERKISVIIGNPPYNANQQNENDNNKNREYPDIDKRIKETYVKESKAQKTKVYDMYSRFYRWASDRLNDEGIIAFITNSSFINAKGFDGFRKCLEKEFDYIYILDLGGDIRSGDNSGSVFNLMIGVAILFIIKISDESDNKPSKISYYSLKDFKSGEEKLNFLATTRIENINFEQVKPDKNNDWINLADNNFYSLIPVVSKNKNEPTIFNLYSNGVSTNRDEWVYDFDLDNLTKKSQFFVDEYNHEVNRWIQYKKDNNYQDIPQESNPVVDNFLAERNLIKWSSRLKRDKLRKHKLAEFDESKLISVFYRPYTKKYLYSDYIVIDIIGQQLDIFPTIKSQNKTICFNGNRTGMTLTLAFNKSNDLNLTTNSPIITLPLYRYEKGERIDNITDWALEKFREYYRRGLTSLNPLSPENKDITKEDIFYYVYGVLHNPKYREKYELNLKREFPRIPFYDDFWTWVNWGKKLMDLHLNYEEIEPYPLNIINVGANGNLPLPDGTEKSIKPKLKADKVNHKIIIDDVTTLTEIPPSSWEYKLGNRSALEWILDQYKEKKPRDKTIAEKFNNYRFSDYKEQVIDLLMRVTTVSVETMNIINQMNNL
ncbi:type ISP restriction/modification enzyme [Cyanobacterium aponinum UTEX 3221]|uniref:type ISP restriction/modification enzyme n=1 Tax=Cyanobacterium aponinum TaxID=379064 RepID=UPI002B4C20AF|nr:type ISP restriction/modification enzyme [Cyanobacterium aponinum]WRL37079.1 type ISP restriction/modification enzyme [Cyanobacterium aponinum UTEX 3221]